ncbi:MAG TPA: extracellular solute-binding protein [Beijerinckiaceae bacterium]|jgi:iron(III) transport system substrate-binding protein
MFNRREFLVATALAGCIAAGPAAAADPVDMQAAKAEGKVVWYTSTPIETAQKISNLFQKETGIRVELFRSGGSAILSRFQQELAAGRVMVDLLTHSDPAAAASMTKKGLFVPFKPANFDKVPDAAKDAGGNYVAQRLNMMTILVRTDKLPAADIPKSWAELTDAKYRNKLITTDPAFTSLQVSVVGMIAKNLGWDYYEKLRKNDMMVVPGNQQIADNLKRAERLIAVGNADSYAADARKEGHPIATVFPTDGLFVIPSPSHVVKGSPNPNAAKVFATFMLSDAVQRLFPTEDGNYAARADMPPPTGNPELGKIRIIPVDFDYIERETPRIKKRFAEIFS